jgi:putative N6-adenine-specific DNA methylase
MPENANFTVVGKSVRSKLSSVPACQAVTEKAVVEKMRTKYNYDIFAKTGAKYKIQISILNDVATVSLDTTGDSLHKRGYREKHNAAPIKETMAAAIISLSFWRKDRVFFDPFCGSGTLAIEAALMAKNIAPGISRKFSAEKWGFISSEIWKNARKEAYAAIDTKFCPKIYASDIDPEAIKIAKENAENAGVDDCIEFDCIDFENVKLPSEYGICVCNPPYAQRLGDIENVEKLYKQMGRKFKNETKWSVYAITSDENFEKCYGRKADKKRKLFNGNIKVDYYQYFGKKPEY